MNQQILAQRTYHDSQGVFSIGIKAPYRDGDSWFCEVFTEGLDGDGLHVGGVDPLQAIRLALPVLDAIIGTRPNAQSQGITGSF